MDNIIEWCVVCIHIPELMWYHVAVAFTELKQWWICRGGDI